MPVSSPSTSISSINRSSNPRSSIFSGNQGVTSSILRPPAEGVDAPTSSIFRVGSLNTPASTSVYHPGTSISSATSDTDEARDRQRYKHIQQMMQQKREAAEVSSSDIPGGPVKTGGGFRRKPFHKRLVRMKLAKPSSYKNLSLKDIKYFENIVVPHAKLGRAGVGFGRIVRRNIKRKIWEDYKAGVISKEDRKDMKKLIEQLPHADH